MKTKFQKATKVFDELTEQTYYGFDFKSVLASDVEAQATAERLVVLINRGSKRGGQCQQDI